VTGAVGDGLAGTLGSAAAVAVSNGRG